MNAFLWAGAALTALGVALIGMMARRAAALKRSDADPDKARAALHGLAALNLAGVGCAALGLGLLLVGFLQ